MTTLHAGTEEGKAQRNADGRPEPCSDAALVPDRAAYREAAALLRAWMDEEGDYDERTWPEVETALAKDPLHIAEEPA